LIGWPTQVSLVSLQTPTVHWLFSAEQSRAAPLQLPMEHVSPTVQN
jgi:hypothetical protein